MIIKEQIPSLSSYKHDVLFKKYENITLYKITSDILKSEDTSSLNKLLTLYKSIDGDKFKYNLTHQPKIYTITKGGYSENPINNEYFQNIEKWVNENSNENDLKTFFSYRGNGDVNNKVIQNCIFGTSDEYNLAPIKIDAIENLKLKGLAIINVNTIATIYKYLLRINDASENLKIMLESLKSKIMSLSDGFIKKTDIDGVEVKPDTSHIEKSLMNQATFKIVSKDLTRYDLYPAAEILYKSVFKSNPIEDVSTGMNNLTPCSYNYNENYDIFYIYSPDLINIKKIYFTNNCDVRYGGLSGNGVTELKDAQDNAIGRVLSYYHHQQKYFYYEDIETKENGKVTATLPTCKIYINLDTCINPANAFGIGYTTTSTTGFYFMVSVKPGFREYVKELMKDTREETANIRECFGKCLDGNWLDICQLIGMNSGSLSVENPALNIGSYFTARLYSSNNVANIQETLFPIGALIKEDNESGEWYLNPSCNLSMGGVKYNISGANEFRLAQYYNNGNILGFFAETDDNEYHPLAIYRSDMELPVLMKKQYIRQSNNGKHVWYFSVGDKDENLNKDQFIEYIGFKVIVPTNGYFKIMHSETFYEGNMIDDDGGLKTITLLTDFQKHSVIPLGRSGVYKYPNI